MRTKKVERLFRIAESTALNSDHRQKMAAIIVKGGKILGTGHNQSKPREIHMGYYSTHAEVSALLNSGDTSGATMYVFRFLRRGGLGMAKPCPLCRTLLKLNNIKRVFYTTSNPDILFKEMRP